MALCLPSLRDSFILSVEPTVETVGYFSSSPSDFLAARGKFRPHGPFSALHGAFEQPHGPVVHPHEAFEGVREPSEGLHESSFSAHEPVLRPHEVFETAHDGDFRPHG
jgi:hypothetical protein